MKHIILFIGFFSILIHTQQTLSMGLPLGSSGLAHHPVGDGYFLPPAPYVPDENMQQDEYLKDYLAQNPKSPEKWDYNKRKAAALQKRHELYNASFFKTEYEHLKNDLERSESTIEIQSFKQYTEAVFLKIRQLAVMFESQTKRCMSFVQKAFDTLGIHCNDAIKIPFFRNFEIKVNHMLNEGLAVVAYHQTLYHASIVLPELTEALHNNNNNSELNTFIEQLTRIHNHMKELLDNYIVHENANIMLHEHPSNDLFHTFTVEFDKLKQDQEELIENTKNLTE